MKHKQIYDANACNAISDNYGLLLLRRLKHNIQTCYRVLNISASAKGWSETNSQESPRSILKKGFYLQTSITRIFQRELQLRSKHSSSRFRNGLC